ncbi:MAG: hypothetical protein R2754_18295 [Microthrixaceae bacterium]
MFATLTRRPFRIAVPAVGALVLVASGVAVSGAQETDPATLSIRGGSVACDANEGTTTVVFERADGFDDLTLDITGATAEIEPGNDADSSTVDLMFDPESLAPGTDSAEAELTAPLGSTATVSVAYETSGGGVSVPERFDVQSVVRINDVCAPTTSTSTPTSSSTTPPTTTAPAPSADDTPAAPVAARPLAAQFTG